jgi:hypothetical protein
MTSLILWDQAPTGMSLAVHGWVEGHLPAAGEGLSTRNDVGENAPDACLT